MSFQSDEKRIVLFRELLLWFSVQPFDFQAHKSSFPFPILTHYCVPLLVVFFVCANFVFSLPDCCYFCISNKFPYLMGNCGARWWFEEAEKERLGFGILRLARVLRKGTHIDTHSRTRGSLIFIPEWRRLFKIDFRMLATVEMHCGKRFYV